MYSGSVVDASNASSSAGLQLSGFTDEVVVNTRVDNPLLTDANIALDGKTLTLNFSRALDSTDVITSSSFVVEQFDGSAWQGIAYSVDGDSTDFANSNSSIVLHLNDSVLYTDQIRVSYTDPDNSSSISTEADESHTLQSFTNYSIRNSSRVYSLESLSSTKSIIYEDLGFDGTPTTAQITSLASEGTVSPDALEVGTYYTIESVGVTLWTDLGSPNNTVGTTFKATAQGTGDGVASTNYLILDSEILGHYYDVEGANLSLYNVVPDHGSFVRNDDNTGWFYRPEVNFSGQVIVSSTYLMVRHFYTWKCIIRCCLYQRHTC